jgi:hypothetical protein
LASANGFRPIPVGALAQHPQFNYSLIPSFSINYSWLQPTDSDPFPLRRKVQFFRGEPLVILEAMKMQNEIVSPVSGTVLKVMTNANTNVMKDDIPVEIKL